MKQLKHFFLLSLCALACQNIFCETLSGSCGTNVYWILDTKTGELTIYGKGTMSNFDRGTSPWYNQRNTILEVTIDKGVTSVGTYAFSDCTSLQVILVNSITPPPCNLSVFDSSVYVSTKLLIPKGRKTAYKNAEVWSQFNNMREVSNELLSEDFSRCNGSTESADIAYALDEKLQTPGWQGYKVFEGVGRVRMGASKYGGYLVTPVLTATGGSVTVRYTDNIYASDGSVPVTVALTDAAGNGVASTQVPTTGTPHVVTFDNAPSVCCVSFSTDEGKQRFYLEDILIYDNRCGMNVNWTLNSSGVLTIIGGGVMDDFSTSPWYEQRNSVLKVVVEKGVTSIGNSAFSDCSNLTSITIPESVMSIGDSAFSGCSSLTSITIPESVKSIGESAFFGCSNLTSITIPKGVTSIGDSAFSGCSSLTSITIPESVMSIGDSAFSGCSSLTSITIPESVMSIGESAFFGCSNLTSIILPKSVTSIGNNAFYDCNNLANVTINYPTIGNWFSGKTSITSVTLGEKVTEIGESAFSGCSNLISITIPESVMSIGDSAFSGCSNLTSINIPGSVISVGESAFSDCSSLANVTINCPTVGDWFGGIKSITSVTLGEKVRSIGNNAFQKCSNLASISIPESVTSIGESAFSGCSNLISITIPESVMSIGDSAFSGCSNLTSINIPGSVTRIGDFAFSFCSSLTSITLPEGVRSIGENAFWGCSSLTSITLPEGVTSIESNAFEGCSSLPVENGVRYAGCFLVGVIDIDQSTYLIRKGTRFIGNYAFEGCSSLTSITIPEGTTSIGRSAFEGCNSLTSINIPEGVTSIGHSAFSGCSSLTSITIPENMTSIGGYAFYGCTSLTDVTINCPTVGNWFNYKKSITSVTLGEKVTSIGDYAFYGCSGLTSITIPASVTSIGEYAFKGCSSIQQALLLPLAPPSIGNDAFPADLTMFVVSDAYASWERFDISMINQLAETDYVYTGIAPELKFKFSDLFTITYNPKNAEKDCGYHVLEATITSSLLSGLLSLSVGYTIIPRPLMVTACSVEREYGMDTEYEYECVGFVEGEDRSVFIKEPTMTSDANKDSDVGEYAIVPIGAEAKNYSFEYVNGKLTIVPASQEIVWDQEFPSEVLIGSEYELTAVATSGLPVSYIVDDAYVSDLYEYDGKTYFGCNVLGTLSIRAVQEGDKNHKSARRVSKTFNVVKELTGVDEVASDTNIIPIYDLSGRRVDASDAVRGIYIQNGKKVYRK